MIVYKPEVTRERYLIVTKSYLKLDIPLREKRSLSELINIYHQGHAEIIMRRHYIEESDLWP